MVLVPEEPTQAEGVSMELLVSWYKMTVELKMLKMKESLARKRIFAAAFPEPVEGTNNYSIDQDFILKGTYPLERKIDEGAFAALKKQLKEAKVNPDKLVKYQPSLDKKAYNKLSKKNKLLFDQCLVIKPGSMGLAIVKSSKKEPDSESE